MSPPSASRVCRGSSSSPFGYNRWLNDVSTTELTEFTENAQSDYTPNWKNIVERIRLDIDDLSANGRDCYGRLICVACLTGIYGQPLAATNFNRLLVDSGHAGLECFTNNEFNPHDWRSGQFLQAGAGLPQRLEQELQQNLQGARQERNWVGRQEGAGID